MLQIRPVSDLRNKFPDIEKIVNAGEPVYLTKNGYGAMVVLSLEESGMLYELLYEGQSFPYNTDEEIMDIARMFGYIRECDGKVMISNRIFETRLYNLFVSEERLYSAIYTEGAKDKNLFIRDGRLDMRQVLERFVIHFTELYGGNYIQNKTGGL